MGSEFYSDTYIAGLDIGQSLVLIHSDNIEDYSDSQFYFSDCVVFVVSSTLVRIVRVQKQIVCAGSTFVFSFSPCLFISALPRLQDVETTQSW